MTSTEPPVGAEALLAEARARMDARLGEWAATLRRELPGPVGEAAAYALLSPGKRVRAALVIAAYRSVGGRSDGIEGVAAAVETVHAYSLVHDDLPCMDDDDLRRGHPTTHKAFDVPTATRAGYILVPVAARILAAAAAELGLDAPTLGRMARELFSAGGVEGMVGGQWADLEAEQQDLDIAGLTRVHHGKTGALIRAACALGGIAAGADADAVEGLRRFGLDIGLAFQVADDVLDVTATSAELGKTAGKDAARAKSTFVRLLGVSGARAEAWDLARRAVDHLVFAEVPSGSLEALGQYIVERSS
ncbi:MAG TPA: polyprenyl synthetase family protein [Gemmatimonadales bacterium]|nr:polyprenyl synthetase family protein [Gemmatimonadales bacterium]